MELLQRIVDSKGQLLRVERDPLGLLLTFDVGRVRVGGGASLSLMVLEPKLPAPTGAVDAGEDEPWWRFLGNPLTAVAKSDEGEGMRLRFRADDQNPKWVRLQGERGGVRATLEG